MQSAAKCPPPKKKIASFPGAGPTAAAELLVEQTNALKRVKLQIELRQTTEELSRTKKELNETRQRLSDVQKRLTVAEQVTAATQQRALQESDNSEQLQLELTSVPQPTTCTGIVEKVLTYLTRQAYILHPFRCRNKHDDKV